LDQLLSFFLAEIERGDAALAKSTVQVIVAVNDLSTEQV